MASSYGLLLSIVSFNAINQKGKKMADRFTFYNSFYSAIMKLPEEEQLDFFRGLCRYAFFGEFPDVTPGSMSDLAYTSILPNVEASIRRRENGAKGGRPKKGVLKRHFLVCLKLRVISFNNKSKYIKKKK